MCTDSIDNIFKTRGQCSVHLDITLRICVVSGWRLYEWLASFPKPVSWGSDIQITSCKEIHVMHPHRKTCAWETLFNGWEKTICIFQLSCFKVLDEPGIGILCSTPAFCCIFLSQYSLICIKALFCHNFHKLLHSQPIEIT